MMSASVPVAKRQRSVSVSSSKRNSAAHENGTRLLSFAEISAIVSDDAEAGAHRLRDLVQRVDLAVRERDVVEDVLLRRLGREPGRRLADASARAAGAGLRIDCSSVAASACSAGSSSMNVVDDRRVEPLARFLLQQADRGVEAHRLVVRPLRHQRVEVVDDRQDARAERDVLALAARPDSPCRPSARDGSGSAAPPDTGTARS